MRRGNNIVIKKNFDLYLNNDKHRFSKKIINFFKKINKII
jgi:hypothetical protein